MHLTPFQLTCALVFGILGLATFAIALLCQWKPQNQTFSKVAVIIRSWWIIAGSFLVALAWTHWGIILFMYLVTVLALREYLRISKVPHKGYLLGVCVGLATLQYFFLAIGAFTLFLSTVPVLCLWIIPGLVIFCATVSNLELVTAVGIGLALMIYYTSHIAGLAAFSQLHLRADESTFAIFILILVTWSNDVFQFLAGKTFGKRKIVPEISPNKTLAGFIGGIVGTMVLTVLAAPPLIHMSEVSALGLGVVVAFTGMLGDLFFSAVKRNIGVKDFSSALPGHGGFLDRLDSLIFTAPIFFHYLLFVRG